MIPPCGPGRWRTHGGSRRCWDAPAARARSCRWSSASPERALAASAMLERHGLLVVAIRPPSVPAGTARLRFAFSAMHEPEPIERAAALLKEHQYA